MKALPTSGHLLLSSLIIAALTGCDRSSPPPAPVSKSAASESTTPKQPAEAATKAPKTSSHSLSPVIPPDVTAKEPFTLVSFQAEFDVLSRQTFVAMNWPVLPDGQPDVSQKPGQQKDNNTVWEAWRESSTIFLPGGAAPALWGTASAPPASLLKECQDLLRSGVKLLTQVGKTPVILTEATQPFNTGPTPFSPPSGPATGSFNGLHAKSKFLASQRSSRQKQIPSISTSSSPAPRRFTGVDESCINWRTNRLRDLVEEGG